jgi:predicted nucleotidyltransferase
MYQPKHTTIQLRVRMKDIREKVRAIVENYDPEKIILFGSHASGIPNQDSDVDLMIIINTERSTWELSVEISQMLKHSFPMDIIVRTPREIDRRLQQGDFFLKDIMENGKILYERIG